MSKVIIFDEAGYWNRVSLTEEQKKILGNLLKEYDLQKQKFMEELRLKLMEA